MSQTANAGLIRVAIAAKAADRDELLMVIGAKKCLAGLVEPGDASVPFGDQSIHEPEAFGSCFGSEHLNTGGKTGQRP